MKAIDKQMSRVMRKHAKLISAFVFANLLVKYLYFLNPQFQASSHIQWLYSLAVSDLVRVHIFGFLMLQLKYISYKVVTQILEYENDGIKTDATKKFPTNILVKLGE